MCAISALALSACGASRDPAAGGAADPGQIKETVVIQEEASASTPASTAFAVPVQPTATSEVHIDPDNLKGQIVRFWHPFSDGSQVFLDLMIHEFNMTNRWGILVEGSAVSGVDQLYDRLQQVVDNGSPPDVWAVHTFQALSLDMEGDTVVDLRPYIANPAFGLNEQEQADFFPVLWQQEMIPPPALKSRSEADGKQVAIPWVRTGMVLVYNKSWAEALGFQTEPASAEEFTAQACAAAEANLDDQDRANDGTGGWLIRGHPAEMSGWLAAFGADIIRADGRGYQFDTTQSRRTIEFLHKIIQDGCSWTGTDHPLSQTLSEQQALFVVASLDDLSQARLEMESTETAYEWEVLPFPPGDGFPALVVYGPSLVLAQSTPERQMAGWLFARWLTAPENQARWAQYNYYLPTRRSALEYLQEAVAIDNDWSAVLGSLEYMQAEPYFPSWDLVRWSLVDAVSSLFTPDQQLIEALNTLRLLDELAAEIHLLVR